MANVFENMELASCCCKPDNFDLKSIRDRIDANRFKVIRTHKRQLPQFDYYMGPLYATDIVFEYDGQLYLLFADIVCEPYILAKWHRQIADVYPGLLKITDPTVTIEEDPLPLAQCECGRYTDTTLC